MGKREESVFFVTKKKMDVIDTDFLDHFNNDVDPLLGCKRKGKYANFPILCPVCGEVKDVKNLGGGSINKYRYSCKQCNARWQQTSAPALDKGLDFVVNLSSNKKQKCKVCGLPKEGHTCKGYSGFKPGAAVSASEIFELDHNFAGSSTSSSNGLAKFWDSDEETSQQQVTDVGKKRRRNKVIDCPSVLSLGKKFGKEKDERRDFVPDSSGFNPLRLPCFCNLEGDHCDVCMHSSCICDSNVETSFIRCRICGLVCHLSCVNLDVHSAKKLKFFVCCKTEKCRYMRMCF